MISVTVNNEGIEIAQPASLITLLAQLQRAPKGIAIAVNQTIVPAANWQHYILNEHDNILIFQAIAGG